MKSAYPRVLVAEADRKTRASLTQLLEEVGFLVVPAASGADALLQAEIESFDYIVLNADLPDREGYEVCDQLRRDPTNSDVPIILTAEARDDMTHAYLAKMVEYAGGDYYLAKPFDAQVVVKLLCSLFADDCQGPAGCRVQFPTRVVWPTSRWTSQTRVMLK